MTTVWRRALPILCAGLLAGLAGGLGGCAGTASPSGENAEGVRLASLPDLPGCEAHAGVHHGALTARAIEGVADLYVIYSGGAPLCIDSREAAARSLSGFIVDESSSNPMPGIGPHPHYTDSNPMPGNPGDPASSNPMPGTDPLAASYGQTK